MTMHTMRGSTGIIKELYSFHANVVSSCDMCIFLATSAGAYQIALEKSKEKVDACIKMKALLWAQIKDAGASSIISWVWLYDAWMHHLDFHIGVLETITVQDENQPIDKPDCIWDYI